MNNDLMTIMTINVFEPSRRVLALLKGLIRRQRPILFYQPKEIVIGIDPSNYFLPLPFFTPYSVATAQIHLLPYFH